MDVSSQSGDVVGGSYIKLCSGSYIKLCSSFGKECLLMYLSEVCGCGVKVSGPVSVTCYLSHLQQTLRSWPVCQI